MITRPLLDDTVDPNWGDQVTDAINFGYFSTYTSTALRLAAIPSPASGYMSYLDSGDQAEGPYWYDGANWRLPWNMPWGLVGTASTAVDQTGITTIADLTGLSVSLTAVTGRRYKASFTYTTQNLTAQGNQAHFVDVDGAGSTLLTATVAASFLFPVSGIFLFTVAAGTRVVKLRGQTSGGTLSILGATQAPGRLLIEDIGPSGTPT